jgi:5-bromo-4-chloroindolyl phosphate hydrolysis protein
MGRGTSTLLAAVAAALTLPLLALGLNLPWWLALVVALAVFGGVWLMLKSGGGLGLGLSDAALLEARSDMAQGLLREAADAIERLRKVRREIKDAPMRTEIARLLEVGDKVVREVREDPGRAMAVRRLLTFYLPNAASVADGWRTLETRATPSAERMTQTREVMGGLSQAFAKYADEVAEPELQTLDLDLKVLKDALKADLRNTP